MSLAELEAVIQDGRREFLAVASAYRTIDESAAYRELGYESFYVYMVDRWGMEGRAVWRVAGIAALARGLEEGSTDEHESRQGSGSGTTKEA